LVSCGNNFPGQLTTATVTFTLEDGVTWPSQGGVEVLFPAGYDLTAFSAVVLLGGFDPLDKLAFSDSQVADNSIFCRRALGAPPISYTGGAGGTLFSLRIEGVVNPTTLGLTGTFRIRITDNNPSHVPPAPDIYTEGDVIGATTIGAGLVIADQLSLSLGNEGDSLSSFCLIDEKSDGFSSKAVLVFLMSLGLLGLRFFGRQRPIVMAVGEQGDHIDR
jgi:hypothetical protein